MCKNLNEKVRILGTILIKNLLYFRFTHRYSLCCNPQMCEIGLHGHRLGHDEWELLLDNLEGRIDELMSE